MDIKEFILGCEQLTNGCNEFDRLLSISKNEHRYVTYSEAQNTVAKELICDLGGKVKWCNKCDKLNAPLDPCRCLMWENISKGYC